MHPDRDVKSRAARGNANQVACDAPIRAERLGFVREGDDVDEGALRRERERVILHARASLEVAENYEGHTERRKQALAGAPASASVTDARSAIDARGGLEGIIAVGKALHHQTGRQHHHQRYRRKDNADEFQRAAICHCIPSRSCPDVRAHKP